MHMLRDYQQKMVADTQSAFTKGFKAPLIVCPTGGGKTKTALDIAARCVQNGKRVLWVAHREELCNQTVDASPVKCGTIGATLSRPDPTAPLQIAMIQTLTKRGLQPPADVVIVDEAHHYSETTYADFCKKYKFLVGLTATPMRSDGAPMGFLFDTIVEGPSVADLIGRGVLVPFSIIAPRELLRPGQIAQHPVSVYEEHLAGRRCLVFARYVKVAYEYRDKFLAAGIKCSVITQKTTPDARKRAILDLRSGARPVCINVATLTEGFDAPEVDSIILARGIGHAGLFLQIFGRALRSSPGKKDAVFVDLRGSVHIHGSPDEQRDYSLVGDAITRRGETQARYCTVCGSLLLSTDGTCAACGFERDEPEAPTVTNSDLGRYGHRRAEGLHQRAAALSKYFQIARINRTSDRQAYAIYYKIYGCSPDAETIKLAKQWAK